MNASIAARYRFARHSRRISRLTLGSLLVVVVFGSIALLPFFKISGVVIGVSYILAVLGLIVLMPMLYFQYSYARSGVWIEPDRIRVQFPGEDEQQMTWSEACFAVDEGEEYLYVSKGKEGLGHLFGTTRYIRLHLEGMMPEQRAKVEQQLSEHVEVRQPRGFTLMTLFNTKGEVVARGRLYLFDTEVLCAENRGEKRVFFCAPIKDLSSVKQRNPFYVGKLECEALTIKYKGKEYVVMLGYETTITSNFGSSSRWSITGNAKDWVDALSTGA
jgi:hypothetical protein